MQPTTPDRRPDILRDCEHTRYDPIGGPWTHTFPRIAPRPATAAKPPPRRQNAVAMPKRIEQAKGLPATAHCRQECVSNSLTRAARVVGCSSAAGGRAAHRQRSLRRRSPAGGPSEGRRGVTPWPGRVDPERTLPARGAWSARDGQNAVEGHDQPTPPQRKWPTLRRSLEPSNRTWLAVQSARTDLGVQLPSKLPVPATDHSSPTTPTTPSPTRSVPSMNHIDVRPLS